MKFFIMLTVILSAFFIISCGSDNDGGGGMTEEEYYTAERVNVCERAFECDKDELKGGITDVSQCDDGTKAEAKCEIHDNFKFDGVAAQECRDCAVKLSCDDFFDYNGVSRSCEVCNKVCVPDF